MQRRRVGTAWARVTTPLPGPQAAGGEGHCGRLLQDAEMQRVGYLDPNRYPIPGTSAMREWAVPRFSSHFAADVLISRG